ncbi:helix-turn-helix domain-containing protein [Streptomyces subrutilus]|uniref:helix-turn-helix domain-containing protein n=1 Tax=Streptomyces subrutilus TaxID=36818 RepID=UPI00142F68A7|nr:helix-turn-helix domain-containing protein [Streptomyces subrutilus]
MGKYVGFRLQSVPPQRRLSVPAATVTLFLGWGDPLHVMDPRDRQQRGTGWEAMAVGLHSHAMTSEISGTANGVQVEFTPLGAYCVLGLPLRHLADRVVHPDEILGRQWVSRLTERLARTPDWAGRCAILDNAITARLAHSHTPSPVVLEAWQRLRETGGQVTVGELADLTGRSRRRLEILFGEQIGLPPKTLARVLRFQNAITLPSAPGRSLAETAALGGYYDQAHFNREFRALTGLTPTQFGKLSSTTTEPTHGPLTSVLTT